jgi:hypothetical protein
MTGLATPVATSGRDHRVDFYRGIALVMIFVNHVPGVLWENFTSRNFGFSDSAELFVFLAGFASAFAYGKGFLQHSPLISTIKAFRRAGVLYLVHIALTMGAVAMFAGAALAFGDGRYAMELGIGHVFAYPLETLFGIGVLGHQLAYVNILPMYSALLLMLPLFLLVLRLYGLRAMLATSAALWLAAGFLRLNLPAYPLPGGWHFNPLAWQFIFVIGLFCGFGALRGRAAVPYHGKLYAAALTYLLFAWAFVGFQLWGAQHMLPLPFLFGDFDKTFVTLPRLLHLLAMIYVFAYAPISSPLSRVGGDNLFTRLGRHSLPIFAVGTLLSLACQIARLNQPTGLLFDTTLILGGLTIQVALALFLDWWREAGRSAKPVPAGSTARQANHGKPTAGLRTPA